MTNWKQKEFGQFVSLRKDKYQPKPGQSIPCVELECITKNSGEITHTISSAALSSIKNHFSKGDILFGKLRPYLRKYALPQYDGVCSTEIWVLRPKEGLCSPQFLFLLIQSKKFIYTANLSCGSRMPRADWDLVSSTPFLLPELPEQHKIVEVLETWDKAIQLTRKLIEQKELQKKYLMQQLLTGRTRLKGFTGKWIPCKLKEICAIRKGEQLNATELKDQGEYPCLNGGIAPSGYTDNWNTEKNTISISEGGNSCGYVNWNPKRFWAGGHCYTLSDIKANPEFLYFLLKNKEKYIMNLRVGSGLPNIQRSSLENLSFSIPESKEEQSQIGRLLKGVDICIELAQKYLAKLEEQKKGLMQVLLTGKVRLTVKENK